MESLALECPKQHPTPADFRESKVESASCPPRRPGSDPCRVLGSGPAFHSGENPGFSRRVARQFRNRRPDLPLVARGPPPAAVPLTPRLGDFTAPPGGA